jgi:transposase
LWQSDGLSCFPLVALSQGELSLLRPAASRGEIPQVTAELAWKVHPRGTDEMRVRDVLGPLFTDTDLTSGRFADMYCPLGRPDLSPALLVMVMILQFRHNLSDADAAQAVADRIWWKYALGLDLDDAGFDASVLTEFRARLVTDERANGQTGKRHSSGCGWPWDER